MRLSLILAALLALAALLMPATADKVDDYILDLKYGQPDDRVAAARALGDIGDLRAVDFYRIPRSSAAGCAAASLT